MGEVSEVFNIPSAHVPFIQGNTHISSQTNSVSRLKQQIMLNAYRWHTLHESYITVRTVVIAFVVSFSFTQALFFPALKQNLKDSTGASNGDGLVSGPPSEKTPLLHDGTMD